MDKMISNPCTKCGKERIDSKTWEETVTTFFGTTVIKHTETVCPDPDCQKVVNEKLAEQRKRKEDLDSARAERMKARTAKN
jgi:hypothetical protein